MIETPENLFVTPENVPSRWERTRIMLKTFPGFVDDLMAGWAPPEELVYRRRISIGSYILSKELGTSAFRQNVAEHLTQVLAEYNPLETEYQQA